VELLKVYVQEVSRLVLVLRYEQAPRDMATSERDVTCWPVHSSYSHSIFSQSHGMPDMEWEYLVVANRM